MKLALFYHSLISDWNHGNAHFLRGVVAELLARGHAVEVFEPADGWSLTNLIQEHGRSSVQAFHERFPRLTSTFYHPASLNLDQALAGVDAVLVHEWNEPWLVRALGQRRDRWGYRLLFHDTHHRCVTAETALRDYDLSHYDGVLAYGRVIRDLYRERGWARQAWTWHEAADLRVFQPQSRGARAGQLVWIGNWGDGERTAEIQEFLLAPARSLRLSARVFGVRYPAEARRRLAEAGIAYGGWLPNYRVPQVFAEHALTIHIQRRPYRAQLPGIPTIRVFEALACGIPLISTPWDDCERLFRAGEDYLVARDGREMASLMRQVLAEPELAARLTASGLARVRARHTCAHRVDELLAILQELGLPPRAGRRAALDNPSAVVAGSAAGSLAAAPQGGAR